MVNLIKYYKKTLIFLSVFFGIIIFLFIYSFYPIINYKENIEELPGRILIFDINGKIITDKSRKNGYYKKISTENFNFFQNIFINSLIKIEDKNFYNNYGINILSKFRAIKDNLSGKKISGASTITEQFIKNKYFIGFKRTYLQKVRESILALYFNFKYSKQEILERYLNNVYFGNNIYGISGAIEVYFNKNKLEDLEENEIVLLLSLLNYPSAEYTGEKTFSNYFIKVKNKLNFSFKNKYIYLRNFKKKNIDLFPFVTKRVLEELCDGKKEKFSILKESGNTLCTRNIIINSTIDSILQKYSRKILNKELSLLSGKNVTNGAIFAVKPKTKEIIIYQGSKDFNSKIIDGEVDVIQSKRQMGSSVKPFLYLMALQEGYNPDDLLIDLVSEYNSFKEGKTYITQNYSLKEYGLVRFKKALGNSMNNATVRLALDLGLEDVYEFYKSMGFEFDNDSTHYGYSLVLGNAEIKLEQLIESYSNLLGKGENKFLLKNILSDPDNRDISFGVNSVLNTSIPQSVKTGTSSDFRDNVIVSYSNDLVIGIWVGNNDNSSMIGVTGITGAGNIWNNIIEKAIKLGYINPIEFSIPLNIDDSEYCLDKNCLRKELIYKKKGKEYFSKIIDGYFSKEDLLEELSKFERDKLKKMGIILK